MPIQCDKCAQAPHVVIREIDVERVGERVLGDDRERPIR
eukprot:COSAG01_NODE_59577_length_299_cov_1.280000_1_plen_38_part_10